jgi:CrcB protein
MGKAVQAWAAVPFPVGTLSVNVLGCLLFGLLFTRLQPEGAAAVRLQLFLTTGLLGGFTTFSTFSQETAELWMAGRHGPAAGYAALSLALCLAATFVGVWAAGWGR